ncbi:MAG: lysophospholipid transporter LplT [Negativicutes bacterium]|jgi:LPLT family lysophospholipid transporter-like MFS transporter
MTKFIRPINALVIAQFFAAFGDNMILYIILAIMTRDNYPAYYAPLAQAAFVVPYILFTPILGRLADRYPKTNILKAGNAIKIVGLLMLLLDFDPAASYFVVGAGAAIYTMAKYGILPWLCKNDKSLVRYNSWVEGSTIAAILIGGITGGILSDLSINVAIYVGFIVFAVSIYFNFLIPKNPANTTLKFKGTLRYFAEDCKTIFNTRESRFAVTGTASFWMVSTVFRMILIVWIPATLFLKDNTDISILFALTGVGLIIGSLIVPMIISMKKMYRAVYAGVVMAVILALFLFIHSIGFTVALLLLVGVSGAILIIPLNATLQTIGKATIGPGRAVACQNIVENSAMLVGVGIYTVASGAGVDIRWSIAMLALVFMIIVFYMLQMMKGLKLAALFVRDPLDLN